MDLMEILSSVFLFKYWFIAFGVSAAALLYQIASVKLSTYNSPFFHERQRNFWFFVFSAFLGISLIGLGISIVLLPFAFADFIGGFITIFGGQLLSSSPAGETSDS